jgi:hypothetical protein
VHMHWSRLIAGAFTVFSAAQTAVFALLMKVISIWQRERGNGLQSDCDLSVPLPEANATLLEKSTHADAIRKIRAPAP